MNLGVSIKTYEISFVGFVATGIVVLSFCGSPLPRTCLSTTSCVHAGFGESILWQNSIAAGVFCLRRLVRIFIAAAVIAVALAGFLIWAAPSLGKGAYKLGFLLGLAAFSMTLGRREFGFVLGNSPENHFVVALFAFMSAAPVILLIEAGFSGYRGFSSWARYLSLSLALLGGALLIAALLAPKLLHIDTVTR